jgi:hypothetical protein
MRLDPFEAFVGALLLTIFLAGVYIIPGCGHTPLPPVAFLPDGGSVDGHPDICLSTDTQAYPGSCDSKQTREGYVCVVCPNDYGCVDTSFQYCVAGGLCSDPRCR